MASNTNASEKRRKHKGQKTGRARKRALNKKGTTRTEGELFGNILPRG
jgi:hypothetical protein